MTKAADIDLYSDEAIVSGWAMYREIRDAGAAVWLPRNEFWAVGRYEDVRRVLAEHELFLSGRGIAANQTTNDASRGNTLASDPPEHTRLRSITSRPLHPKALADVRPVIEKEAEALIERLVDLGTFDAMTDLAQHLPLSIVSNLVGLPEAGRARVLKWAAASFDAIGPENERTIAARPITADLRSFVNDPDLRHALKPGGWAAKLFAAADAGDVEHDKCPVLLRDYLGPSLDTTIFATGHLIRRLATTKGAWDMLRENPKLAGNAINEAIRIDTPVRVFTRYVAHDCDIGGESLAEGSRVGVLFASANRDERVWDDPDRYDITRRSDQHLGFGHGVHICMGMQLARLEMRALLEAMIRRVARIDTGTPVQVMNNVLFGFESLPARFVPA